MTKPRRRRFRLVYQPEAKRPWIAQYSDNLDAHAWRDIVAFHDTERDQAVAYIDDIRRRDQILLDEAGQ